MRGSKCEVCLDTKTKQVQRCSKKKTCADDAKIPILKLRCVCWSPALSRKTEDMKVSAKFSEERFSVLPLLEFPCQSKVSCTKPAGRRKTWNAAFHHVLARTSRFVECTVSPCKYKSFAIRSSPLPGYPLGPPACGVWHGDDLEDSPEVRRPTLCG